MSETDRLRDLLEQAAPNRPDVDPTSRAAAVARRGRNARVRDRALVTAAAVSVVAVVVAIPRFVGGDDGPDQVTPAPPAQVEVEPCPVKPVNTAKLVAVPALGELAAVQGCPVQDPPVIPVSQKQLVGEAAQAFADDVMALPTWVSPQFCMVANVMSEPWALQVQPGDGEPFVLGSPMRVCSSIEVDRVPRGVEQIVAAFEGNLDRQESGGPGALACPTGERLSDGAETWNASFDPATATAGVVCYRVDPMGAQAYADLAGTLTADQLATIRDDLTAHLRPTPDGGMCTDTGPQRLLVLADAEGDQAAFVDDDCISQFESARGYWVPSPEAEDAIAEALGGRVTG